MTTDEKREVLQAFLDGKEIEFQVKETIGWEITSKPVWDFESVDYRIKTECKCKTKWLTIPFFGYSYCTKCLRQH